MGMDTRKLKIDYLIPAKNGLSLELATGDVLRIIDEEGEQVADLVAFNRNNLAEHISAPQTNKLNSRLNLRENDYLYSTDCKKIFQIKKISNARVHCNFLFSPCGDADNAIRFPHQSKGTTCLGILQKILAVYAIDWRDMLEPFSIGLHLHIKDDGAIQTKAPLSKAGDYIELATLMPCIVGITACPQDRNLCNNKKLKPIRIQVCTL